MLPLHYAKGWRVASLVILSLVLVAALMPAVWFWDDRVAGHRWLEGIDKWMHGITFAVLALWFAGLYARSRYWIVAIGLLAFGLLIEICQRMVSYRTADWLDVGADVLGIIAGLAIALAGLSRWSLFVEERMLRRQSADSGD